MSKYFVGIKNDTIFDVSIQTKRGGNSIITAKIKMANSVFTTDFQVFFAKLAKENWGTWPSSDNWPKLDKPYTAYQQDYNGGVGTFINYSGKKYLVRPISKRKPEGDIIELR